MKKIFAARINPLTVDFALVLIRLIAGSAMMVHGYGKILAPFSWMPAEAPIPGIFQALAALSEFGGGMALILGLLTPLAMLGLSITMAVAAGMHIMNGDPFVSMGAGPASELASLYFAISVYFLVAGPGRFSADRMIFGQK